MELHINYEDITEYEIKREDKELKEIEKVKPILKADKELGEITIDNKTILKGIPKETYNYKLGNRSAIEWILDQYKHKKLKDKTLSEKFDNYDFSNHKEYLISLIKKIITLSLRTLEIKVELENLAE